MSGLNRHDFLQKVLTQEKFTVSFWIFKNTNNVNSIKKVMENTSTFS